MAYTGGWRAHTEFYKEPGTPLHTADPAHSTPGSQQIGEFAYEAPPSDPAPDYMTEYPGQEWVVVDTPGLVLDSTPVSHTEGLTAVAHATDLEMQHAATASHAVDQGAGRAGVYATPPMQFHDERYLDARFEGLGPVVQDPIVTRRGLNGLPENNPPDSEGGMPHGFRLGWVMQNFVDRKFAIGERVHDQRMLTPNTAWAPADQPAGNNQYTSPFDGLARGLPTTWSRPMLRRNPPPVSEDMVTDGSEDVYPTLDDWVVG